MGYCLATLLWLAPCSADDSRPVFVEIKEVQPQLYKLHWQIPPTIALNNWPSFQLPSGCGVAAAVRAGIGQHYHRCENSLAGSTVNIVYPQRLPPNGILLRFIALSGEQHTRMLSVGEMHWKIPAAESVSGIASDYTTLGIQHILIGWDHLLFIACLLWIAGGIKRVLLTITGFTLAHSITLALAALELIRIPVAPVEAVIALSVVFLTAEIAAYLRSGERRGITWRYPLVVSSGFGLLHGLGFAAVLNEIGLPQTDMLTGLVFFNIGVEIGQLIFALGVMGLLALLGSRVQRAAVAVVYSMGAIAAFWVMERCVSMVTAI